MEPYRPSRKRMSLDTIYSDDGHILANLDDIGEHIEAACGPVLEEKEMREDDADFFLLVVPEGVGMSGWSWPMGSLQLLAAAMTPSARAPMDHPSISRRTPLLRFWTC